MAGFPSGATFPLTFTGGAGRTALWGRDRAALHEAVGRDLAWLDAWMAMHGGDRGKAVGAAVPPAVAAAMPGPRGVLAGNPGGAGHPPLRPALNGGGRWRDRG